MESHNLVLAWTFLYSIKSVNIYIKIKHWVCSFSFLIYICFLFVCLLLFFSQRLLQKLCFAGKKFNPKSCKLWSVENLWLIQVWFPPSSTVSESFFSLLFTKQGLVCFSPSLFIRFSHLKKKSLFYKLFNGLLKINLISDVFADLSWLRQSSFLLCLLLHSQNLCIGFEAYSYSIRIYLIYLKHEFLLISIISYGFIQ